MKKAFLFLVVVNLSLHGFSQENLTAETTQQLRNTDLKEMKISSSNLDKAFGDTLWYEDFSGGFTTNGWSSIDSNQFGFDWIYTTAAPGGQYSTTIPIINSSSVSNGFASLPSDLYNTPTPGAVVNIYAYLVSSAIAISPVRSLKLRWRQAQRFCCASTDRLEVQISTDSVNWASFDAKFGRAANTNVTEDAEIDITSAAANSSTIYIRFFQTASHYFWMIDDIALIEGYNNAIELDNPEMIYGVANDNYYAKIPKVFANPYQLGVKATSIGGDNSRNVKLNATIIKNNTTVFNLQSALLDSLERDSSAQLITTTYGNNDGLGAYEIRLFIDSDSINQVLKVDTIPYEITDSIYAKDDGTAEGYLSPGAFSNPIMRGRIGTKYYLNSDQLLTSVAFYIGRDNENVGIGLKAQVWGFDGTQTILTDAIELPGKKYESAEYIIDSTNLDSWFTFSIKPAIMLDSGEYVLALEQVSGDTLSWQQMSLGRDRDSDFYNNYEDNLNSFIYRSSPNPVWGRVYAQPMMRMHFGKTTIGFKEFTKKQRLFSVSPNPSTGQLVLDLKSLSGVFQIRVVNVLGQEKYVNQLSSYTNQLHPLDLTNLEKGIYFVILETEGIQSVEKIVIR